ncbi:MAG: hypothetical protein ACE1ZE_00420, partial [Candidatus Binatia bacterium]
TCPNRSSTCLTGKPDISNASSIHQDPTGSIGTLPLFRKMVGGEERIGGWKGTSPRPIFFPHPSSRDQVATLRASSSLRVFKTSMTATFRTVSHRLTEREDHA